MGQSNAVHTYLYVMSFYTYLRGLSLKFQYWCRRTIIWNANHKLQVFPLEAVLPQANALLCVSVHRLSCFPGRFLLNLPQFYRRGRQIRQNMVT